MQGTQVSNQSAVFALRAAASSRLATAYTSALFLGAAAGSVAASVSYELGGWGGVCAVGAAAAGTGLLLWLVAVPR